MHGWPCEWGKIKSGALEACPGEAAPALPRPTQGSIDRSRQISTHIHDQSHPAHPPTQLTSSKSTPDSRLRTVGAIDRLLWQSQELAAALPNDAVPAYVMATAGRLHHVATEGGSRPLDMAAVMASGCVVERCDGG